MKEFTGEVQNFEKGVITAESNQTPISTMDGGFKCAC